MARVYLSIGSNIDRENHIRACLRALESRFSELHKSPCYESEAVGFDGDNFYNMVVGIDTCLSVGDLSHLMREIENQNGRDRNAPRFSSRTLDIDILTYDYATGVIDGVELPRDEITKNAFVLLPLAELAPDEIHPLTKLSYKSLWDSFSKGQQKLWRVTLGSEFV